MEDDPERRARSGRQGADAVAHRRAVVAAAAARRSLASGEDEERDRAQVLHMGSALRPRPLLDQHDLAALEVVAGAVEHRDDLEGEGDVAVEILMKRVPAAGAVPEDQRGRARLARLVALREKLVELARVAHLVAEAFRPGVRDLRQGWIERGAQLRDRVGQGMVEILVLTLTEAVTGHRDRAPEPALLVQLGQLLALLGLEHGRALREAVRIEGVSKIRPGKPGDARLDGRGVSRHGQLPSSGCATPSAPRRRCAGLPWPDLRDTLD